jgi:DNA polymerase I-like protein with 3'-5' exonuclease and polymerase domains
MPDLGVKFYGIPTKGDEELLFELLNPPSIIGVDTETPNLIDQTVLGIGIATSENHAFWIPRDSPAFEMVALRHLRNPQITKVFWNAKFDYDTLEPYNIDLVNFEDAEILAYTLHLPLKLYDFVVYSGKKVEQQFLDFSLTKEETTVSKYGIEFMGQKCCTDSRFTLWSWNKLQPRKTRSYEIDRNIVHILRHMEKIGVALDMGSVEDFNENLQEQCTYERQVIYSQGCDPNSNQQVGVALTDLGFKLPLTPSGQFQVNEEVLADIEHPLAQGILVYREKHKVLSTYVKPLLGHERVYTQYNSTRVVTGRLSSGKPKSYDGPKAMINMQNIPEFFRIVMMADEEWISRDASQVELRVIAWQAQDKHMMDTFADPKGDIHATTMKRMGINERRLAKVLNFATVYGAEWFTIIAQAKKAGIRLAPQQAMDFQRQLRYAYPQLFDYIESLTRQIKKSGQVTTMFGRIRKADSARLNSGDRKQVEAVVRELVNMPTQGSASEIVKIMMHRARNYDLRIQVHDELVYDGMCPPLSICENVVPFLTPMSLKTGKKWGELTTLIK